MKTSRSRHRRIKREISLFNDIIVALFFGTVFILGEPCEIRYLKNYLESGPS